MMLKNGYVLITVAAVTLVPAVRGEAQDAAKVAESEAWLTAESEWFAQDDADSLYRAARAELRARNYERASNLFRTLRVRYANSSYVAQSMYWEAFALHRIGDEDALRRGLLVLREQEERFPDDVSPDARSLAVQIQGKLARQGDVVAAEVLARQAEVAQSELSADAERLTRERARAQDRRERVQDQGGGDDLKLQALNALMQMDAEVAMPILQRVLSNRTAENAEMRRRAVFLIAQSRGADREALLIDVVRNDPDAEVKSSAVFHLSQVRTPEAVAALDSILQSSTDRELQEQALFALSQHRSERGGQILRDYAQRRDAPMELRATAIQWLGQRRDNTSFIRDLYQTLDEPELRQKALFALSQTRDPDNADFLLSIATNTAETLEVRKMALFWLGNMRVQSAQLYDLYTRSTEKEIKEQLIFVYSQRRNEDAAIEKLIDIVRTETDEELQGTAIFWLGQTRDPRAIAVVQEIINR